MAIKYDKFLKHIREQDGDIRSFNNEGELSTIVGSYDGELIFVRPNSVYGRDGDINSRTLIRNRVFPTVGDLLLTPGKDGEIATVSGGSAYFWNGTTWKIVGADLSAYLKLDQTTPQTTVGRFTFPALTVDTNTLFVDSVNHRLGIGTNTPGFALDVQGNNPRIQVKNTGTGYALLQASSAGYSGDIYFGREGNAGGALANGTTGYSGVYNVQGSNPSYFAVNNNIVMTMLNGGNVGIGMTNPSGKLEVSGSSYDPASYAGILRFQSNSGTNDMALKMGAVAGSGSNGYTWIQGSHSGVDNLGNLVLNQLGGNVGIGTTNPFTKFEISNTGAGVTEGLSISNYTTPAANIGSELSFYGGTGQRISSIFGAWSGAATTDGYLAFRTRNANVLTEQMRINNVGNVGIRTTTPLTAIDVVGNAIIGNATTARSNSYGGTIKIENDAATQTDLFLLQSGVGSAHIGFKSNDNKLYIVNSYATGLITDTTGIVIDSNGNLGVGTTSPTNNVDIFKKGTGVTGSLRILSGDGASSANKSKIDLSYMTGGGLTWGSTITAGYNGSVYNLAIDTNTSTSPILLQSVSNGYVGIGMTTAPIYKLDVRGTANEHGIRSAMGFDIYQVPDPTAPTGVVSAGGSVDTGDHWYAVSYITVIGETHTTYTDAKITTTAGNNTVTLTIPVSTDPRVTGRKIYRTKAGGAQYVEYLLATVNNNTDTTYVDTVADSTLTGTAGLSYFKPNTTSRSITVNGARAFTLDTKGTFVGLGAGTSLTTGGRNVFVGQYAGQSVTEATDGVAVGHFAGAGAQTGTRNVLIGSYTGRAITSGASNAAIGSYSLFNTTTGYYNSCLGDSSLQNNVSGYYNSAIGTNSLYNNTSGHSNISIGYNSLYSNVAGYGNVAIGLASARMIADGIIGRTSGNYGLYLGYNAKASADGTDNENVLGYNAIGNGSDTFTYGNSSITKHIFGAGNVGIGTTTPAEKLEVNGTIKATDYKSSDGSTGATGSFTTADSKTVTVKNGLIVSIV